MRTIKNKEDLKLFLSEDKRVNLGSCSTIKMFAKYIFGTSDGVLAVRYLYVLRHYEYFLNKKKKSFLEYFILYWLRYRYNHLSKKYNIVIYPNITGFGLRLPHVIGGGYYNKLFINGQ